MLILKYKATRKSNHQCALITRSFLVFRHMKKAVTAALTKKAISNAKGRSFEKSVFRYCCWKKVFLASIRASGGAVENQW